MILAYSFTNAGVFSFGPLPAGWSFDRLLVSVHVADGSADASLVLSASIMRRQIKTAGLVAGSVYYPLIPPSSTLLSYTAVALNTAAGPAVLIPISARQPLPVHDELWLNVEAETCTNLRGALSVEMVPYVFPAK